MAQVYVSEWEWELRERLVEAAEELIRLLAYTPLTEREAAVRERIENILADIEALRERWREELNLTGGLG
jgi:hypothetical protein